MPTSFQFTHRQRTFCQAFSFIISIWVLTPKFLGRQRYSPHSRMKPGESSVTDATVALICNRSYQGEGATMKAAIGDMAALSGSVEMGALRSKEWAYNVSRIATTAESWLGTVLIPRQNRSTSPSPNSSWRKRRWDKPHTINSSRSPHNEYGLQQKRAIGNGTSAMAMTLSCWVPT